jgi:AraC-like DNA-binding protein
MIGAHRALSPLVTLLDTEPQQTDELSGLLQCFRWSVLDYAKLALPSGRSRSFRDAGVRFHYVADGAVRFPGVAGPEPLLAGDFLILPRAGEHELVPVQDAVVLTGMLRLESPIADELLDRLPDSVLVSSLIAREPLVAALLEGMSAEACAERPGSGSVISGLANVVATTAIRTWIEHGRGSADARTGAVRDVDIARAVAAIQADPGRPWSIEVLAQVALASRSAFVKRFSEVTGVPPARYVTMVRVREAKRLLQQPDASVSQVAVLLGYGSDAAFSRAFRRVAGAPPSVWRRRDPLPVAR